jgi:DNA-binding NtrC family response regulator
VKRGDKTFEDIRNVVRDEILAALMPGLPGVPPELTEAWEEDNLNRATRLFQEALIIKTLRREKGDRTATAKALGIGYSTLKTKLRGVDAAAEIPSLRMVSGRRRRGK